MGKPAFDPTQAYSAIPDQMAKPAFDPTQAFTTADESPPINPGSFINSARAAEEGLERGLSGGLSDKFQDYLSKQSVPDPNSYSGGNFGTSADSNKNLLSTVPLDPTASSSADIQARQAASPLLSGTTQALGHFIANPVSAPLDAIFPNSDGPKILPQNDYFNPTYGGVAKGLGDFAVQSPELLTRALAGVYPQLQKMSLLSMKGAKTFAENPDAVNALANTLKTTQGSGDLSNKLTSILKNSASNIGDVGKSGADLQRTIADGHTIELPVAALQNLASDSPTAAGILSSTSPERNYASGLADRGSTVTVPVSHALDTLSDMNTSFSKINPLTGQKIIAEPAVQNAWGVIRNLVSTHPGELSEDAASALQKAGFNPEGATLGNSIDNIRTQTANGIGLQKSLIASAKNAPIAAVNTGSLDQLGDIQNASKIYDLQELSKTLDQMQAAREMNAGSQVASGSPVGSAVGMVGHMSPGTTMMAIPKSIWNYAVPFAKTLGRSWLPDSLAAQKAIPSMNAIPNLNPWNALQAGRNVLNEKGGQNGQ